MKPPQPRRLTERETHHGITREDHYAWLRAENWNAILRDPESLPSDIADHLRAENAYMEAALSHIKPLQRRVLKEMRARVPPREKTLPERDGDWLYYRRFREKGEHPLYCRKPLKGGKETIILNAAARAGAGFYRVREARHAPNHEIFAWSEDRAGGERYEIYIRGVHEKDPLRHAIADSNGNFAFSEDSESLFYVLLDDKERPYRVMLHQIGEPQSRDELIYEEKDSGFFVSLSKSLSRDYVMILAYDHTSSEARLVSAHAPREKPRLIAPREKDLEYWPAHDKENGRFLIRANSDGAEDFKIVSAPEHDPSPEHWRDIVEARAGCYRIAHQARKGRLIWLERENAQPRIMALDYKTGEIKHIALESAPHHVALMEGLPYDDPHIRILYSSPKIPQRIYDSDPKTGRRKLRKRQTLPVPHRAEKYRTERIFAEARDGEKIPISLLYLKSKPPNPERPLLLYGYGAYGIAIPAGFSSARLSLVDRGMTYAIAHIRGGSEKGRRWYLNGRFEKKHQSFTDFIDSARHLIERDLTGAGKIAAHGGSAGGLLMGAVANQAPELFSCVIAEVPFVDVLATMLDSSLPLTPPEWPEWGNPIESKSAYELIKGYSPYDNVSRQRYPPILATAGLSDPRVGYWEPAKWIAQLRHLNPDGRFHLKTHMGAGHGGASGRFARLDEIAFIYAFALSC